MDRKKYYRSSKIIRRSFRNQRLRIFLYNLCVFFISSSLSQFSFDSAHIAAEILPFLMITTEEKLSQGRHVNVSDCVFVIESQFSATFAQETSSREIQKEL
jgi:hypothetical protein